MTTRDIARLADVSISTVSKIMNSKDKNVNPETRNRVLKVVKDYNYVPYGSVKNTSEAKTFVLGALPRYISKTNLFLNRVIPAVQAEGYSVVVYDSNGSMEHELKNITSPCKNHMNGVIWKPACEQSLEYQRYFDEQNIGIYLMSAAEKQPCYFIDFEEMGYRATQVLLGHHHQKLGCLTKENSQRSWMVLKEFRRCLFDNNIPFSEDMKLPMESGEWYNRIPSHVPTGIVNSHYVSSAILMEWLEKFKFKVPYDLSPVSLRDDVRKDIRFPRVSSTKTPYYEFRNFVCDRLIRQCKRQETSDEPFRVKYPLENTLGLGAPFSPHAKWIVVVGSINIDVTLNVNELPQPGKTISTNKHSTIPGGKGANQSVSVAKLENEVALIGQVSNGRDSALVYACVEERHVGTRGIRRDIRVETGKTYIHVQNDGEGMITILAGANQDLSPAGVNHHEDLFGHPEYCLLQTEVLEIAVLEAARQAHKHGVKNILKPAAINQIDHSLMQYVDILAPNRKEAGILCPKKLDIESKAEVFQAMSARAVIITLGHHGCYIKNDSFCGYLPAADFVPVDTTGATDAFIATLAVYLLNGHSLVNVAKIATYAADFCVSRQDVIPAMIDRNSLGTYTARKGPELVSTHSCLVWKIIDIKNPESGMFLQTRDLL